MPREQQGQRPARIGSTRDWPDMPEFPVEFSIQSREKYKADMKDFWYKCMVALSAMDEDIAAKQEK